MRRSMRGMTVAIAALAIAVVLLAGVIFFTRRDDPQAATCYRWPVPSGAAQIDAIPTDEFGLPDYDKLNELTGGQPYSAFVGTCPPVLP